MVVVGSKSADRPTSVFLTLSTLMRQLETRVVFKERLNPVVCFTCSEGWPHFFSKALMRFWSVRKFRRRMFFESQKTMSYVSQTFLSAEQLGSFSTLPRSFPNVLCLVKISDGTCIFLKKIDDEELRNIRRHIFLWHFDLWLWLNWCNGAGFDY